eukprot:357234-Chlamydomonas_euryale.AAC.3
MALVLWCSASLCPQSLSQSSRRARVCRRNAPASLSVRRRRREVALHDGHVHARLLCRVTRAAPAAAGHTHTGTESPTHDAHHRREAGAAAQREHATRRREAAGRPERVGRRGLRNHLQHYPLSLCVWAGVGRAWEGREGCGHGHASTHRADVAPERVGPHTCERRGTGVGFGRMSVGRGRGTQLGRRQGVEPAIVRGKT